MLVKSVSSAADANSNKVIVVDDDVDIFNLSEVLHAFTVRCHPGRGIRIVNPYVVNPLSPFLSEEERKMRTGASVLFDCTWPVSWNKNTEVSPRMSFRENYDKDIQEKVLAKWRELKLKENQELRM